MVMIAEPRAGRDGNDMKRKVQEARQCGRDMEYGTRNLAREIMYFAYE